MATRTYLCCDRCGTLFNKRGDYWIETRDGRHLHFCKDGEIGEKTKIKEEEMVEKK